MKSKLIVFFVYQSALLAWCFKLHHHYFEFAAADQVGLTLAALAPLFLWKVGFQVEKKIVWIIPTLIPLILFPTIDSTLAFFSDIWILLYFSLLVSGSTILLSAQSILSLAGIGTSLLVWVLPFSFVPNQTKYYDRLTETFQTRKGEVDIVTWKGEQWFYYNNALVLSTVDGHMHSEALTHTVLPSFKEPSVLLLGDDFGFTREEIKKYTTSLTHIPFDYEFARQRGSLGTESLNQSIMAFLESHEEKFEIIIIDLPDPEQLSFKHFYEPYFYSACLALLTDQGYLITNAGSYYADSKPYRSITTTLQRQELQTIILQALVPTLGHRTWVLAGQDSIRFSLPPASINTIWYNQEALDLMQSKGKNTYPF